MQYLNNDSVLFYAKKYFHLDFFFMEYIDSIKEGDGDRIFRCWRYMLLLFKVSNKTKYSVEAYNLQYLHTTSICSVKGCANSYFGVAQSMFMVTRQKYTLHMEHLNRDLKNVASHLRRPQYARSISSKSRKGFKDFNRNTTSF